MLKWGTFRIIACHPCQNPRAMGPDTHDTRICRMFFLPRSALGSDAPVRPKTEGCYIPSVFRGRNSGRDHSRPLAFGDRATAKIHRGCTASSQPASFAAFALLGGLARGTEKGGRRGTQGNGA